MARRALHCPSCRRDLSPEVSGPYHLGFSDCNVAYCVLCGRSAEIFIYYPQYPLSKDRGVLGVDEFDVAMVEALDAALAPCPCGGVFSVLAPPLCPHCRADLRPLLSAPIYYLSYANGLKEDAVWRTTP